MIADAAELVSSDETSLCLQLQFLQLQFPAVKLHTLHIKMNNHIFFSIVVPSLNSFVNSFSVRFHSSVSYYTDD